MEDLVPRRRASCMPDVHPVGREPCLYQRRDSMHHPGYTAMHGVGDLPDVSRMLSRNDERMSP